MGEVYLAEDTKLHRKVAIKLLPQESQADEQARKRLIREARAAARLDHPNICAIHEVNDQAERSYIVMQYVDGETLADRLRRKPLTLFEALDIAIQTADALSEAHLQGIIHRDIKPQNILVNTRGQVKVLDFGLAKSQGNLFADSEAETEINLTSPGVIMGSVPYLSPEQARAEMMDARSDIFSFGTVVYEIVTGRHPFRNDSAAATIAAILMREPPPLKDLNPSLPTEMERIISKTIRKDKDRRYQTMKEVVIDLTSLRDEIILKDIPHQFLQPTINEKTIPGQIDLSSLVQTNQISGIKTDEVSHSITAKLNNILSQIKRHKRRALILTASVILLMSIGFASYKILKKDRSKNVENAKVEAPNDNTNENRIRKSETDADNPKKVIPTDIRKKMDAAIDKLLPFGSSNKNKATIYVQTKHDLTSSGLIIQRGDRILVTASGLITLNNSNGQKSGPEGIPLDDPKKLMRSQPTGALIAIIGADNKDFIFIGNSANFISKHEGLLFLGINEGNLSDNEGDYEVSIEVQRARKRKR